MFGSFLVVIIIQEYTKLGDVHPRAQERMKKMDPAEYSNMANPHTFSRYVKIPCINKNLALHSFLRGYHPFILHIIRYNIRHVNVQFPVEILVLC